MMFERMRIRSSDPLRTPKGSASAVKPRGEPKWTTPEISSEAISRRAYEKFLARGCQHGDDLKDWFKAERELKAEIGQS